MKRYEAVIMATAVIPWDSDFRFMKDLFTRQVELLVDNDINNIYLFGTAGEGYAVTERQFDEISGYFAELSNTLGFTPMAGLIDLSVARMKEKLEIAYRHGIREFQFSLPSWGQLNDLEVDMFFDSLLPVYPDCRFLNYNLGRAKRFLEPEELFQLAKKHENFAAVKHTRGLDEDYRKISASKTPLQFFVTEQNFMEMSKVTECGLLMSVGNVDLKAVNGFFRKCLAGKHADALSHLEYFMKVRAGLKKAVDFQAIDSAYDKLYTRLNIPEFPLRLLPPYQYADDKAFKAFQELFLSLKQQK